MKRIILFALLVFSAALYSEIKIEHTEPFIGYKNSNLYLDFTVEGDWQEILEMIVYYRERGEVVFSNLSIDILTGSNGDYQAIIPVSEFSRGLEYYLEVKTKLDETITYPENQPTLNPIMVQIIENVIDNDFVVLNDLTDLEEGADFSLSVSLFNLQDKLDYESIKFFKDGKDATKEAIITPTLLVYSVSKLKKSFSFRITGLTVTGEKLDSGELTVNVKQKMFAYKLPFNVRGNVNFKGNTTSITYDDVDNVINQRPTDTYSSIFNVSGNNRYAYLNSRIYLSSLEDSDRQSVNRYSFDVRIPHYSLYLGDKTPYLSEFTLNGTNVRGFGSKLNFKYFLLEGYWGSSARKIDTIRNGRNYQPGTFKRETGAVRIALGNQNAFQIGLNIAKNKDRVSSLDYDDYYIPPDEPWRINPNDKQIINPVDNIVFSTDFKLNSPRNLYSLGAEMALSGYNSNIIDGAISQEELEDDIGADLPFDPESVDGFFIINKNIEPLSITTANLAYKINSSLYIAGNLFSLNYSRVGSAFNSLSARNINTDTQQLTFSDNINFHNTIFVDFSYNRVTDNLSENLATTNEFSNYSVNSIFRKEKFPILRASFNKGRTSIENNDEIEANFDEAQEFRSIAFGGGIGYSFDMIPYVPFSLDLDYQNSLDQDDLNDSYEYENNSFYIKYKSKMTLIPLTTEISSNYTNSTGYTHAPYLDDSIEIADDEWRRYSTRLKLQYEFVNPKVVPFLDYRISRNNNENDSDKDDKYTATSVGLSYYPFKLTSLTSSFTFKDRSYENVNSDYSALNWYLNIVQKF